MTIPLTKPVRREVAIRAGSLLSMSMIVTIDAAGITFRPKGKRRAIELPWNTAHQCAERLAGERAHREKLREAAIRRHRGQLSAFAVIVPFGVPQLSLGILAALAFVLVIYRARRRHTWRKNLGCACEGSFCFSAHAGIPLDTCRRRNLRVNAGDVAAGLIVGGIVYLAVAILLGGRV